MRRAALVVTATLLVLAAAGCAGDTDGSREPAESTESTATVEATATPGPQTAQELRDYLQTEHGEEGWFVALDAFRRRTKLGSPVFELHFAGSTEEAQPFADSAFDILSSPDLQLQGWVEAWAEGKAFAGVGLGSPREVEYPNPPTNINQLVRWLRSVYGRGERVEPWYAAIESIELGESAAQTPIIRVETTLPIDDPRASDQANLVLIAVAQSQPSFASEIEVWYADGDGLVSGGPDTYNPYVY